MFSTTLFFLFHESRYSFLKDFANYFNRILNTPNWFYKEKLPWFIKGHMLNFILMSVNTKQKQSPWHFHHRFVIKNNHFCLLFLYPLSNSLEIYFVYNCVLWKGKSNSSFCSVLFFQNPKVIQSDDLTYMIHWLICINSSLEWNANIQLQNKPALFLILYFYLVLCLCFHEK